MLRSLKKFAVSKLMREIPFSLEEHPCFSSPKVGLAVLGHPIAHSISPVLHKAALEVLSTKEPSFSHWTYERLDVHPKELRRALDQLSDAGFIGLNLTIPHKVEVLDFLEHLDDEASIMGAVNTLALHGNKWTGYNTDGYGLKMALEKELSCDLVGAKIFILGAGGAARAAATQTLLSGANLVHIHNRTAKNLNNLTTLLHQEFDSERIIGSTSQTLNDADFCGKDWIVINATSLGLKVGEPSPLSIPCKQFGKQSVFYDMIYNPPRTKFLCEAEASGFRNANGLSMLVYQAKRALEIWSNREISAETMFEAAKSHFGD